MNQAGETQPQMLARLAGGHRAREGQEVGIKVRYSAESS